MMDVTSTTNTRTVIANVINGFPCGHKSPTLTPEPYSLENILSIVSIINSYTYDFIIRSKLGGQSLIWGVLEETVLSRDVILRKENLLHLVINLVFTKTMFAQDWIKLKSVLNFKQSWYQLWAITPHERLRIRCILDAIIAELYVDLFGNVVD